MKTTGGTPLGRHAVAILIASVLGAALALVPYVATQAATASLSRLGQPWQWTDSFSTFYSASITTEMFSSPAVGDIDGNGVQDVVAGFPDGHVYAWRTDTGARILKVFTGQGAVQASPTLVDLNGNGIVDILTANTGGDVMAFSGFREMLFHQKACGSGCGAFGTPVAADIDRDGQLEVIVGGWSHYVHVWNLDGSYVPGFPVFTHDTIWSSPAVGDLDKDGWLEIVIGVDCDGVPGQPCYPQRGGYVYAYRHNGKVQPGWPRFIPDQVVWSTPAVVDLDHNGWLDVVVGTGNMPMGGGKKIYAFHGNGADLPGWPVNVGGIVMGSPAVGNIAGDSRPEVVAMSDDGRLHAFYHTGARVPGWPQCMASDRNACPVNLRASASIADVDNDGVQEVVSGGEQWLRVYSQDGTSVRIEAELETLGGMAPLLPAPTVAQVGGKAWIVTAGGYVGSSGLPKKGAVFAWESSTALGRADWPTFKHNTKRTGSVLDDVAPTATVASPTKTQTSTKFGVSLSGNDSGSGIAHFDVDVREPNEHYVRWASRVKPSHRSGSTASRSLSFYGIQGESYRFRVRAVDRVGNVGAWSYSSFTDVAANATKAMPFTAMYGVTARGANAALSSPPTATPRWSWDIVRDAALRADGSGYLLDGWGGVHAFEGAPKVTAGTYWPGWDIARGLALHADGSGYVLDGWGVLHPFGGAKRVTNGPYWHGWDIARAVVLLPSSTASAPAGYVLDGWGGVHPFGSAKPIHHSTYWPGFDIARDLSINPDGLTGYVVDGWGALHGLGHAKRVYDNPYWEGRDVARSVVVTGASTKDGPSGYVLDAFGGVHDFGSAPAVVGKRGWPSGNGRALALAP